MQLGGLVQHFVMFYATWDFEIIHNPAVEPNPTTVREGDLREDQIKLALAARARGKDSV